MFDRLGWLVLRLRFVLVAGWLVAAGLFGVLAPSLSQAGSADETSFLPKDAESLAARQVVAAAFPSDSAPTTALIVFSRPGGLTDGDRLAVEGLRGYFEGNGHPDAILLVSYPFYLWHLPVIQVLATVTTGYRLLGGAFVVTAAASAASVLCVERPFRRAGTRSRAGTATSELKAGRPAQT